MDIQNPFVPNYPVRGDDFLGRADILSDIHRFLQDKKENAYIIYAHRRMGKTSLLLRLKEDPQVHQKASPVYFNLQGTTGTTQAELLREIAGDIRKQLSLTVPQDEEKPEVSREDFQENFIPALLRQIPETKSLLLMLDEAGIFRG